VIIDSIYPIVATDDFARRFSRRGGNLMWLLGAGASAAAGIPTAWDMIWEFKQQLYVSQRRVSAKQVADLANPAVRRELQTFIDGIGSLPAPGSPDEYAALFESVYPSEADRRTYIASKISGAKPSYGHVALATLMKGGRCRLVWTTNFDPLVADGCAKVYGGTGQLTTAAIETGSLGRDAIDEGRWPVEVKIHGDFRSRRLKNTGDELREQDAKLRALLIDSCNRWGLVATGYSGRDESVMDTLEAALERDGCFPAGLFWLHHGEDPPLPRVQRLLAAAAGKEVDGGLVPIENFDETLRDLMRLVPDLDTTVLDEIASERRVWSPAPRPTGNRDYPVVRLNAIELTGTPTRVPSRRLRRWRREGGQVGDRSVWPACHRHPFESGRAGVRCRRRRQSRPLRLRDRELRPASDRSPSAALRQPRARAPSRSADPSSHARTSDDGRPSQKRRPTGPGVRRRRKVGAAEEADRKSRWNGAEAKRTEMAGRRGYQVGLGGRATVAIA
jgi:NAD-dependent SIR2 family protein deacetylase